MEQFLQNFCEILELDAIPSPDKLLSEIEEWDSLAIVSFVAMADLKYQEKIRLQDLKKATTISDLYALLQN